MQTGIASWTSPSAFGVAGLGHRHPEIVEAMKEQSDQLLHGMGDVHPTALKVELCEQLSKLTFEKWGAGSGKVVPFKFRI
jgi:4-aminobutyrate aminotransferase-like enzyme